MLSQIVMDEHGQGLAEGALILGALSVGMTVILNVDLHSFLILANLFLGTLQLLFPVPLPNFVAANSLSRLAVRLLGYQSEQRSNEFDQSVKEAIGLVKKYTETASQLQNSLLYKIAYRTTKIFLAINSFKKQNQVIVVHLDRFVQVYGDSLYVPNLLHPILQGIATAAQETKGDRNVKIGIVFESEKVEDIAETLMQQLEVDKELLLFSSKTPDEAKEEIKRRGLAVPYVLTLVSEDWKGFHRILLNKLIEGLSKGFERGIKPLQNLWEMQVYEIQA